MHFFTFVAAALLPYAASDASVHPAGADCQTTCYGQTCLGAAAVFGAVGETGGAKCETMESWGCDCTGCDCDVALDLDSIDGYDADSYSCSEWAESGLTCDDMAFLGYNCHYMETRKGADCSGCLCEEAVLGYEKGDGSCPMSCFGATCDVHTSGYNVFSCELLESFDWVLGCDCSGCTTCDSLAQQEGWPEVAYQGMDCNGNGYWSIDDLGDGTCGDEIATFTMIMGNPDDGYAEWSWFNCVNCPELSCDMGDCGDSCERGDTCALPLCELCADENSVSSPTQFGRSVWCTDDSYTCAPSPAPTTAAPTVTSTEATVAAGEEDGSRALTTAAVFAVALLLA